VIDWGAIVDDYPSDITRTYAIGSLDPELAQIYEVVKLANAAARAAAKPGATGQDLDNAARAVITEAGYGEQFFHRTGHGLGLEVHEPPYIMEGNNEPLAVGEVFTIEPGIYLPGRAGVRIEDDVVITSDGHRTLTTLSRDLVQLA
jgi:Xaa-Pro dipeptidase